MKLKLPIVLALVLGFMSFTIQAQEREPGHVNTNKFRQLKDVLPTPNEQHTASGAPGKLYTQQQVDYVMDITLDDENQRLYGEESITYHNNSEDTLKYLWLQLDQNMRAADSKTPDIRETRVSAATSLERFDTQYVQEPFDGGFKIQYVKDAAGKDLPHMINRTMMRIELPKPLAKGEQFEFSIKWWYNINNYVEQGGRSGYEHFEDGNNNYIIAQFYPRLCVYDNVEGWQNMQFWGRSEFALEFGDFQVNITTPSDHVLAATGVLTNPKEVMTKTQLKRFKQAENDYENPVMIVTQEEAEKAEKGFSKQTKTWSFDAKMVRDFAFASSRKYIWDAMAVDINGKRVMAHSLYPKEGNPLWEEHSTRAVAQTLETYSRYTFDYPYHKAISVHAKRQGMEYPQICFNFGRPNPDGTYSERTKYRMLGVIIHEVGHNYFPMIVNSDERQWTWMDEGLNSFVQILAQQDYDPNFPLGRGIPKNIVRYMSGDQSNLAPIMSQGDNVYQFGPNAYSKPAAGLYMLRQTIMGPELFDYAFKTYAQRWKFKHPTPADFFRSMEDASAMDLDWFFRGWFYTTDYTDIGIKEVKKFYASSTPTEAGKSYAERRGMDGDLVYFTEDTSEGAAMSATALEATKDRKGDKFFYQVTYEKPGGLVMPVLVDITYEDGSKERKVYPAQIWRLHDKEITKVISSSKPIKYIVVDTDNETADIDMSNNEWGLESKTKFEEVKTKIKG